MSTALLKETQYYTYSDYLEWDEDVRAEIIDGEVFFMPAPLRIHQEIVGKLFFKIYQFLESNKANGGLSKVYVAPFAVRLFPKADNTDDTVLEPDIVVVCDPSKLDKYGCTGAPDMVIEILSPSTARVDRIVKRRKYQNAGVREYWLVDPDTKALEVCTLNGEGLYTISTFEDTDTVPISVLEGCAVDLSDLFSE
jgi:Uma2 family endonuclease